MWLKPAIALDEAKQMPTAEAELGANDGVEVAALGRARRARSNDDDSAIFRVTYCDDMLR